MTQTQSVEFVVTGKDRLSDRWVTVHFTERRWAEDWADRRAFVLPDADGNYIRVSASS